MTIGREAIAAEATRANNKANLGARERGLQERERSTTTIEMGSRGVVQSADVFFSPVAAVLLVAPPVRAFCDCGSLPRASPHPTYLQETRHQPSNSCPAALCSLSSRRGPSLPVHPQPGKAPTAAALGTMAESLELTAQQLLRVDVQAALAADFVLDNTRHAVPQRNSQLEEDERVSQSKDSAATRSGGSGGEDVTGNGGAGWMSLALSDPASALSSLLSTVQSESAVEHLTAGLRHSVSADEGQDVLARLARQLAALGLSADQTYHALAYKRSIIVNRLYEVPHTQHHKQANTSSLAGLQIFVADRSLWNLVLCGLLLCRPTRAPTRLLNFHRCVTAAWLPLSYTLCWCWE